MQEKIMETREHQARAIWSAVLGELQLQLPPSSFETWLKGTEGVAVDGQRLLVRAPNAFAAEWLEKRLHALVSRTIEKVSRQALEPFFQVRPTAASEMETERPQGSQEGGSPSQWAEPPQFKPNRRYTFDSFVVGPSNRLAFAASKAVAGTPGESHNPLFIYSGAGLGKTHLLHAIAHSCLQQRIRFLYVTSEHFTNDFVTSVREKAMDQFRSRYRGVDVLLMDDVQFLSGKEQTLEGFFHTFNDLHNSNRQVVITSDQTPQSIPAIEERLRSRFAWGLIADIQPPSSDTRVAILEARAREMGIGVMRDVLGYIAQHINGSVRELEGALNRTVAMARAEGREPHLEMAKQALQGLECQARMTPRTPEMVLRAVGEVFSVPREELLGKKRHKELALARHVTMYLLRHELDLEVARIGRVLGGKNHATILHGIERVTAELPGNALLRERVEATKAALGRS
ncbi:MAG: chromosomal replication initiator protein DnaA [SAR202 cluster bacterium]|nr:chromosomal replication initiator protein DnaA [SAR202 cluster bacterium]